MSQPAFDFGDEVLDDAAAPTYTVTELGEAINDTLRRGFDDGVWVRGEITGWNDRGNHAYFTLVDDGTDGDRRNRAVLNVQFFANVRVRLRPLLRKHRLRLADGMRVRIFGYLDFYAPTGRLGLKMAGIDPRFTLGDLAQTREEVMRRLVAEGLLDANRRRPLSPVPLRLGVVTSVGTAAWHDFHDELQRSGFAFAMCVVDTRVQGELAESMITASIRTLARRTDLDAVVVVRGGGARNELAVFDTESIARAIAGCPHPVLTGLGHEIDRSVADDVAHTALKTPTACAGALIARVSEYVGAAEHAWRAIGQRADVAVGEATSGLSTVAHRIARRTHAAVERADERLGMRVEQLRLRAPRVALDAGRALDARTSRLDDRAGSLLSEAEARLARTDADLLRNARRVGERELARLDLLTARLAALDPALLLARGWSITRRHDGTIVRDAAQLTPGEAITTTLAHGTVVSTVDSTEPPDD